MVQTDRSVQKPTEGEQTMKCYSEFPLSTVIYNMVTLGGALGVGVVIVAQLTSISSEIPLCGRRGKKVAGKSESADRRDSQSDFFRKKMG